MARGQQRIRFAKDGQNRTMHLVQHRNRVIVPCQLPIPYQLPEKMCTSSNECRKSVRIVERFDGSWVGQIASCKPFAQRDCGSQDFGEADFLIYQRNLGFPRFCSAAHSLLKG
jgi:hypothetical protein